MHTKIASSTARHPHPTPATAPRTAHLGSRVLGFGAPDDQVAEVSRCEEEEERRVRALALLREGCEVGLGVARALALLYEVEFCIFRGERCLNPAEGGSAKGIAKLGRAGRC